MKPHYFLIAAVTIDGKIAKNENHFTNWTSKEDKVMLRKELNSSDVIVVGNNTYKTAKDRLSKRNCIIFSRNKGKSYFNPQKKDIKKFVTDLGYKKVCILGGMQVYSYFLEKNLIDEMLITIEPLVFGSGLDLFGPLQKQPKKFTLKSIKKLNKKGSLLLRYTR